MVNATVSFRGRVPKNPQSTRYCPSCGRQTKVRLEKGKLTYVAHNLNDRVVPRDPCKRSDKRVPPEHCDE